MILFILIVIQVTRAEVLFNCTFNDGFIDDCLFDSIVPNKGETLKLANGQQTIADTTNPPSQPTSDATSVFSPTIDGEQCLFPYEINGWNMYFCWYDQDNNNSHCPTVSGNQTCHTGQYAYVNSSNPLGFLAILRSNQRIVSNTTDDEHCLRFFSYLIDDERNASIILRMSSTSVSGRDIITVVPHNESRWYRYEISFHPISEEYHLLLIFNRIRDFNDTASFTFALDDILITSGPCVMNETELITTETSATDEESISEENILDTTKGNEYSSMATTAESFYSSSSSSSSNNNKTQIIITTEFLTIPTSSVDITDRYTVALIDETTNALIHGGLTTTTETITVESDRDSRHLLIIGLSLGLGVPTLLFIILISIYIIEVNRCFIQRRQIGVLNNFKR